jgi:hypothetical protein
MLAMATRKRYRSEPRFRETYVEPWPAKEKFARRLESASGPAGSPDAAERADSLCPLQLLKQRDINNVSVN